VLLPEAQRLLNQAAALPGLAQRAASGETGRLSLAFVSTADYSVLPTFLRQFRDAYPQVQIDLREATSDVQFEELANGGIDAGLLSPPLPSKAINAGELDYLPARSEPLVAALPSGMRGMKGVSSAAAISLERLGDQPLVIFPRKIAPALHDAILTC